MALAVRLGKDEQYRRWAGKLIDERSHVLWERQEVVNEWAKFLARAARRLLPTAGEVSVYGDEMRLKYYRCLLE